MWVEEERSILNISGTNIIKITREWNSRKIDIEAVWETITEKVNLEAEGEHWRSEQEDGCTGEI